MRDKSIPLPEDTSQLSDLYPSEETLEDIIDVSPDRPRAVVQDSTGAYRQYEDGSTLVRNPKLGPYPLAEEAEIDGRIAVNPDGQVRGVEKKEMKIYSGNSSSFADHIIYNAGLGIGDGRMRGGIADILIAIDISWSMEAAAGLVSESLPKLLQGMRQSGAKEVRIGIVVFRDHPVMRFPLYWDDPADYDGIEVLEYPGSITSERIQMIESKLKKLIFHGGEEPVGMAVRRSMALLELLPKMPELRSRQVVVLTDNEGLNSWCGDHSYPQEDQYASVRREASKLGIIVSHVIMPTGAGCGCVFGRVLNCVQG